MRERVIADHGYATAGLLALVCHSTLCIGALLYESECHPAGNIARWRIHRLLLLALAARMVQAGTLHYWYAAHDRGMGAVSQCDLASDASKDAKRKTHTATVKGVIAPRLAINFVPAIATTETLIELHDQYGYAIIVAQAGL